MIKVILKYRYLDNDDMVFYCTSEVLGTLYATSNYTTKFTALKCMDEILYENTGAGLFTREFIVIHE